MTHELRYILRKTLLSESMIIIWLWLVQFSTFIYWMAYTLASDYINELYSEKIMVTKI